MKSRRSSRLRAWGLEGGAFGGGGWGGEDKALQNMYHAKWTHPAPVCWEGRHSGRCSSAVWTDDLCADQKQWRTHNIYLQHWMQPSGMETQFTVVWHIYTKDIKSQHARWATHKDVMQWIHSLWPVSTWDSGELHTSLIGTWSQKHTTCIFQLNKTTLFNTNSNNDSEGKDNSRCSVHSHLKPGNTTFFPLSHFSFSPKLCDLKNVSRSLKLVWMCKAHVRTIIHMQSFTHIHTTTILSWLGKNLPRNYNLTLTEPPDPHPHP